MQSVEMQLVKTVSETVSDRSAASLLVFSDVHVRMSICVRLLAYAHMSLIVCVSGMQVRISTAVHAYEHGM